MSLLKIFYYLSITISLDRAPPVVIRVVRTAQSQSKINAGALVVGNELIPNMGSIEEWEALWYDDAVDYAEDPAYSDPN
ncbi:hypothetical protein KIN20_034426 [Parelaphostrongylus tenuis]|uniref:Uncharacterized protein n=1 Tax=Parelaphostrongylus tenuis TaxID=148309 RepID=A0AAD5WJ00_PARTN|nr:hypothetical protein KIN20_034426 [Parelaphostrongylus tenuis]